MRDEVLRVGALQHDEPGFPDPIPARRTGHQVAHELRSDQVHRRRVDHHAGRPSSPGQPAACGTSESSLAPLRLVLRGPARLLGPAAGGLAWWAVRLGTAGACMPGPVPPAVAVGAAATPRPIASAPAAVLPCGCGVRQGQALAGDPGRGCVRRWPGPAAARQSRARHGLPASVEVPGQFLGWQGGGEKVGEQLGDPLGLVVMDPVRGVGQALNAVEVGHVVVVRLG